MGRRRRGKSRRKSKRKKRMVRFSGVAGSCLSESSQAAGGQEDVRRRDVRVQLHDHDAEERDKLDCASARHPPPKGFDGCALGLSHGMYSFLEFPILFWSGVQQNSSRRSG